MLLPTVSVTVIGLLAGLLALLLGRYRPGPALVLGVVGAWIGSIAGALVGVIIDVMLQTGTYVAVIGHAAATAGAFVALTRFQAFRAGPRSR
jgi:hypothetical protein